MNGLSLSTERPFPVLVPLDLVGRFEPVMMVVSCKRMSCRYVAECAFGLYVGESLLRGLNIISSSPPHLLLLLASSMLSSIQETSRFVPRIDIDRDGSGRCVRAIEWKESLR